MRPVQFVVDLFSPLSHKHGLGDGDKPPQLPIPTYVPEDELRRMAAYQLRAAYMRNVARNYLATADDDRIKNHREYGDARALVEAVRAAVIGDGWQIVTDGADDELANVDLEPEQPEPTEDNPEPEPVLADLPDGATVEDVQVARRAVERQEWMRGWADDELFALRLIENERKAGGLGDSVYQYSLSTEAERVRLHVWDPQFYFPVLEHWSSDYPRRVHIAYGFKRRGDNGELEDWVRRQTWELGSIDGQYDEDGRPVVGADGSWVPRPGDKWQVRRRRDGSEVREIVRDLRGRGVVNRTCYYSDGEWKLATVEEGRKIDDLTDRSAVWRVNEDGQVLRRVDLGIDFIPLLHVPNTWTGEEHYGEATIDNVLQILDDLSAADTDVSAAASTTGRPPIAVDEGDAPSVETGTVYRPGTLIRGKATVIDTSDQVRALIEFAKFLLDRLSVNARVPGEVQGRVKASDVPSGFAFLLGMTSFKSLIGEMRQVREVKFPLGFEFVQRWTLAAGYDLPGGDEVMRTTLAFGSYLPSDLAATVELIVKLLDAHGISRPTALRLLVDAGLELPDSIADELERISGEDVERAQAILDLTDSPELAAAEIGIDLPAADQAGTARDVGELDVPIVRPPGGGGPGGEPGA